MFPLSRMFSYETNSRLFYLFYLYMLGTGSQEFFGRKLEKVGWSVTRAACGTYNRVNTQKS
jgi:CCR4-NOT transcriptional regulation complex NOT5 subunit